MNGQNGIFSRFARIVGDEALSKLAASTVAVCGVGGVGGEAALALARSGVGSFVLVDRDIVDVTNINRQAVAYLSTVGKSKCSVMRAIIADVNPNAKVTCIQQTITADNAGTLGIFEADFVVDAVDDVAAKVALCLASKQANAGFVSAMGAGNRLNPAAFCIADISKTHTCPLARKMRRELGLVGIKKGIDVCFSTETPAGVPGGGVGSSAFAPCGCGLTIASHVVQCLLAK